MNSQIAEPIWLFNGQIVHAIWLLWAGPKNIPDNDVKCNDKIEKPFWPFNAQLVQAICLSVQD